MIQVQLKEVCEVVMGQAPKGDSYNMDSEGYPLIAGAGDFGETTPSPVKFTNKPTKLSRKDDLIVCVRATIGDLNWSDQEYCLGRGVAGLRPDDKQLDKGYLWHWIGASKSELEKHAHGSTFKQISRSVLDEHLIPLPPLSEQRRIAAILDKADAIRKKRREAIALADEFLRSAFLEMFGDLNNQCTRLEMLKLVESKKNSFVNGPFGSNLLRSEMTNKGVPVVYIRDIRKAEYNRISKDHVTSEKAKELKSCNVMPGDVLIAKVGDPPGTAAIYPDGEPNAIVTQDVIRMRLNKDIAIPEYIVAFLNSTLGHHTLKPIIVEATRSRFSLGALKAQAIPIPDMSLQIAFRDIWHKSKDFIHSLSASTQNSDHLFHSLTQRAFRGEL